MEFVQSFALFGTYQSIHKENLHLFVRGHPAYYRHMGNNILDYTDPSKASPALGKVSALWEILLDAELEMGLGKECPGSA